jgi:hypothetical protein
MYCWFFLSKSEEIKLLSSEMGLVRRSPLSKMMLSLYFVSVSTSNTYLSIFYIVSEEKKKQISMQLKSMFV